MGCRLFTHNLCCRPKGVACHPVSFRAFFCCNGTYLEKSPFEGVNADPFQNEENDQKRGKESKAANRKKRSILNVITPSLDEQKRKEVKSVMGLHLGPSALYWAKIEREGNLVDWNHKELFPIAEFSRKIQLPKLYEILYFVLESIPFSDVFVLEGSIHGVQGSLAPPPSATAASIMRSQIVAMLVVLLNNRPEVEENPDEELEDFHKVYFLKPRLMGRLFHLLVGTERVSALALVDSILDGRGNLPHVSISEIMDEGKMSEGCQHQGQSPNRPLYTPIRAPPSIIESYRLLRAVEREAMSQPLLLAMAFYDLAVFKDPKVLAPLQLK